MANDALTRLVDTILVGMPQATCADILELAEHLVERHALPRATEPNEIWPMPKALATYGPLADAVRRRRDELTNTTMSSAA